VSSEKLQKFLATLGYGSRREIETWITAGRVAVNGEPAHLGQRVSVADQIQLDGKKVGEKPAAAARVIIYNKPAGVICTRSDPEGRPTIFQDLPPLRQGRWISVGRLDIQTTGLLLLSNDGVLADRMMRPATGLDREYAARVNGRLSVADEKRLLAGVTVDGDELKFSDLRYFNGRGVNHWYHVVLMEGRNREVRRLFESVGLSVSRLKRVRYGPVIMPSTLARGRVAELGYDDLKRLYGLLKLPLAAGARKPRASAARSGSARSGSAHSGPAYSGGKKGQSFLLPYPELPG
jgi:23S rRNA pseudouridine2605 synthase